MGAGCRSGVGQRKPVLSDFHPIAHQYLDNSATATRNLNPYDTLDFRVRLIT